MNKAPLFIIALAAAGYFLSGKKYPLLWIGMAITFIWVFPISFTFTPETND